MKFLNNPRGKGKFLLDFLRGLCYFYTVREENKAEFHSHLSARDAARVYIAQYYRHWSVYQWVYESVDFCPHFFSCL